MTTNYTASNGITIHLEESEMPVFARPATGTPISPGERLQALREYFQHQRDQELGRWRDPETGFVVYRDKDYARTLSERTGDSASFLRRDFDYVHGTLANDPHARAARAYFAAHPETKPWHDAKPGEAWVLTIDGTEEPAIVIIELDGSSAFQTGALIPIDLDLPDITAGHRIWPEESDDE